MDAIECGRHNGVDVPVIVEHGGGGGGVGVIVVLTIEVFYKFSSGLSFQAPVAAVPTTLFVFRARQLQ